MNTSYVRATALFCLLFSASSASAQQNTLFDTVYAHPPARTTAEYVVFPKAFEGQQMSAAQAAQAYCDLLGTPSNDDSTQYDIGPCELIDNDTRVRRCITITSYWPNGNIRSVDESCVSTQITLEVREQLSCPPEGYVDFDFSKDIDNALWCFSLDDILDRDLCPDSLSDGSYVLPVNQSAGNESPSSFVCDNKEDGSSCAYRLAPEGDYYQADFESNGLCYTDESIDAYQGQTNLTDEQSGCINIGAQTLACIEDENRVCNAQGICQSGCGYVNEVFVCLSNDIDGDNIGDYADPDIDGDGIPNDLDLDNDGDGIDDPIYHNGNTGGAVVNVDLSETNALLAGIANKTGALLTGQGDIAQAVDSLGDKIDQLGELEFNGIEFSENAGGRACQYLCEVFGPDELEAIKTQAQSLREQIAARSAQIRDEIAGVVNIDVSGSLSDILTTIKGQQYGFKWSDYEDFWQIVGNLILVLTAVLVLVILLGSNNK